MTFNISEIGGYNYEFVDTNLPDEFECPICTLVPRDVHQASCCGKMFCKSCLDELKRKSTNYACPNCREDLEKHCFKDANNNRKICNLHIYCKNKKAGCKWVGTIQDFDNHFSECPHELIPCSNKCGRKLKRYTLENHIKNECPKRKVTCTHCQKEDEYHIITGIHIQDCPDLCVQCPNDGCTEMIKRRILKQHRNICTKEVVDCKFHHVGCEQKLRRECSSQHNEENMKQHLELAVDTIAQLRNATQEIKITQQTSGRALIKMIDYKALKQNNKHWLSPAFYTSFGGYKLQLLVFANGIVDGEGTHVSCFINLMPGEYDDTLEWPFQGVVTVELLNQLQDRNHCKDATPFNDQTPDECKNRKKKEENKGWGEPHFIPHTDLGLNSSTNTQYLMNDTLYFRVSVNVHSKTKPWLAI